MNDWHAQTATMPALRGESHYGDRVVTCFADRPNDLNAMLDQAVARNGAGEALVQDDERLSWHDVEERVACVAGGLARHGIAAGDRVALILGNSIACVIALFAIARLGAVAVPLSVRAQKAELEYMLDHCEAKAVIHEAALAGRLPETPALRRFALDACPGSEPFDALLAGPPHPPVAVDTEDAAWIIYTSGTTGRPKGATLTHLGVVHAALHYEAGMGLTMQDRSLIAVPMSHVTGLAALIVTVLRCASTLVVMPEFKAADFLARMARERITHTLIVPAMYNLCLLQPDFDRHDLSAWRIGGYGGAPMPDSVAERLKQKLPALTLMNAYGASETICAVVMTPPNGTACPPGAIGQAVPWAEVLVMDDDGREVEPGQSGELWLRCASVAKAYWNNPQATVENFIGGYWRSGDIGKKDESGWVWVLDRKKDMINRGGYKIYSVEVENVLSAHPGVLEAAVLARPCPVLGERVHAFIVPRATESWPVAGNADPDILKSWCVERLSDYKVPESMTFLEVPLPRNANGKVQKNILREWLRAEPDAAKRQKESSKA